MASFLENIEPFRGTGERNKDGQTLEEFLEGYQPYRYETPSCTTDAVVFSYRGMEEQIRDVNALEVLLVKRSNHPSIGFWALPGGFINLREDLEETARRELQEETGVSGLCMEQIAVYGAMDRDPRTRVITTAYMALVNREEITVEAGDDAADAAWCKIRLSCVEEQRNGDTSLQVYRLQLFNEEKQIDTTAVVEKNCRGELVREVSYRVREPGEDCGGSQCDPCAGTFKTAGQNGRKNFSGQVKSTLLSILFYGKILNMNENEEDDNGERSSF